MYFNCLTKFVLMLPLCSFAAPASSWAQVSPGSPEEAGAERTPERIIQAFTEKETEYFEAWMQYTCTQTAEIRVLSVQDTPVKEAMRIVSKVGFNDEGMREVRIVERQGRLKSLVFTKEDEEGINNLNPFFITAAELPLYKLKFEGKERIPQGNCFIFSVQPKNTKGGRLYFKGKVWVNDADLQIVRTVGKVVPETQRNKFPEFETLRRMMDGKYLFPVRSYADDMLHFEDMKIRIEETVTYTDYKPKRSNLDQ